MPPSSALDRPRLPLVVGVADSARLTKQSYTEVLRGFHATRGRHAIEGKMLGRRYLVRVTDLATWLAEAPYETEESVLEGLMNEPKLTARVFDLQTAARAYSVSPSRLKSEILARRLRAKRVDAQAGAKYLVSVKDLDAWFDALPDA